VKKKTRTLWDASSMMVMMMLYCRQHFHGATTLFTSATSGVYATRGKMQTSNFGLVNKFHYFYFVSSWSENGLTISQQRSDAISGHWRLFCHYAL